MPSPLASAQIFAPLESAASLQSVLANGGRFLLTFAMALFLSYLLFMVGSVVLAIAASQVRRAVGRPARDEEGQPAPDELRRGGRLTVLPGGGVATELPAAPADSGAVSEVRRTGTGGGA